MKKIYSLLSMTAIMGGAIAQSQYLNKATVKDVTPFIHSETTLKVINDTTGLTSTGNFFPEFAGNSQQATSYGYIGGGNVFGSNIDSLNTCAQGYENSSQLSFSISEVLVWFFEKYDAGNNGTFSVQVWGMDPNSAYSYDGTNWNQDSEGPSGMIGSQDFTLSDVDTTTTFSSFTFSNPVSISGTNFAIAVDASGFITSGDTIGIVSDSDGDGMNYAFHRKLQGPWMLTSSAFSIDNNAAIFAVVSDANVGINSNEYLNGLQMSAFPNPAVENTTISFGLKKAFNNVTIEVIDSKGAIVSKINKGALAQGVYNEVIDLSNVAAGKYYYSIITNESRLTKKIMVVK